MVRPLMDDSSSIGLVHDFWFRIDVSMSFDLPPMSRGGAIFVIKLVHKTGSEFLKNRV